MAAGGNSSSFAGGLGGNLPREARAVNGIRVRVVWILHHCHTRCIGGGLGGRGGEGRYVGRGGGFQGASRMAPWVDVATTLRYDTLVPFLPKLRHQ